MSKAKERMNTVVNVVVISATLMFLGSRNGPIRPYLEERANERDRRAALHDRWNELQASVGRLGQASARVRLITFIDYQCPFCRRNEAILDRLIQSDQELAVAYRHLPLPGLHDRAWDAALASVCSESTGDFEVLHRYLISTEEWYSVEDWTQILTAARVSDPSEIVQCMTSGDAAERVENDVDFATRLGITGTPAFATAEHVVRGFQTKAQLEAWLR